MPRSSDLVKAFACGIVLNLREDQLDSLPDKLRGIRIRKMLPDYSDGLVVGVLLHLGMRGQLLQLTLETLEIIQKFIRANES